MEEAFACPWQCRGAMNCVKEIKENKITPDCTGVVQPGVRTHNRHLAEAERMDGWTGCLVICRRYDEAHGFMMIDVCQDGKKRDKRKRF